MNEDSRPSTSDVALRRWRRAAILFAVTTACSLALLAVTAFLAVQDLNTHYNLYYLLWKAGIRPYERPIAFGGLFHDSSYQQRLIGVSFEQFTQAFPNTFYKVRKPPPIAKPNQEFYINDYQRAQREDGRYDGCWEAIFEDGRLVAFDYSKA